MLCFKSKGFTLIELLIVVAIIAILAAIAVPNFLEAQTRAKVASVKADMRSLATALEAYYVDHNNYVPPCNNTRSNGNEWSYTSSHATAHFMHDHRFPGDPVMTDAGGFFYMLSTPVAYIANSFLPDPFGSFARDSGRYTVYKETFKTNAYLKYVAFNKYRPISYYGYTQPSGTTFQGIRGQAGDRAANMSETGTTVNMNANRDPQIHWWALYSWGPDGIEGAFVESGATLSYWSMYGFLEQALSVDYVQSYNNTLANIYDPTNGTKSQGNVWRLGGGRPAYALERTDPLPEFIGWGIDHKTTGAYRMYFALTDASE